MLDSDREFYLPVDDDYNKYNFPEGFEVDMALKVYAKIEDYSTNSETSFVYLDWYMDKELRLNIKKQLRQRRIRLYSRRKGRTRSDL